MAKAKAAVAAENEVEVEVEVEVGVIGKSKVRKLGSLGRKTRSLAPRGQK
jgi:fructose/tagatose bisphosphate aldolase